MVIADSAINPESAVSSSEERDFSMLVRDSTFQCLIKVEPFVESSKHRAKLGQDYSFCLVNVADCGAERSRGLFGIFLLQRHGFENRNGFCLEQIFIVQCVGHRERG